MPARHICFDRVIPARYDPQGAADHEAALGQYRRAVEAHAPRSLSAVSFAQKAFQLHAGGKLSADHPVEVMRMAILDKRKWDKGFHLRCRFLDGSTKQQQRVKEKALMWQEFANIHFDFGKDPNAEIRISFGADEGSWSAVGKDCLNKGYFPDDQPTMNFGWLRDNTDDTEYRRVVVHEFGHALGCIHEHQSPNEELDWNVEAVYEAFSGPPNYWSKKDIDSNILEKYSHAGTTATVYDAKSIMLYQFDGSLFLNGVGTPENTNLSELDKKMINRMYPGVAKAMA